YIPAELTPELVEDRHSCILKTTPLNYHSAVPGFIDYSPMRNRDFTKQMLRRKDLYFPMFEKYLAQYNLPDELKYLSIIESALNPRAVSRASAVGLWQFMAYTGRYFGLHNDYYFDERMDPEKSTEAACRYIGQLYSMFGSWELTLAAYNSGPGTVKRAIRRSGYKKSFWEIYNYLPRETRSYVPQFIAMIYTINYAEDHNLFVDDPERIIPHDTITVNKFLHLETFAQLTGSCADELLQLNPTIRHMAIPDNKSFTLKLPLESKQQFAARRLAILDSASRGRKEFEQIAINAVGNTAGRDLVVYHVKNGDVLGLIAQRHRVRVEDIRTWNNLQSNMIRAGQRLNIWVLSSQRAKTTATGSAGSQ
ncbi:MAG: transglycosylase SLT domain-containing protein, partial [Bacteroidetes bacterium]|nr:transglycosylase SLT domain-containing protein [Bacteroidota bacterium]